MHHPSPLIARTRASLGIALSIVKGWAGWQTRVDLALSEIIGEVSDSQLVHTRVSRDPADIWERLQATHVLQGLGSIIAIWQHFFTLKKANDTSVQAHASAIRELADRLTGLGDVPSETLMVSVLMLSLPDIRKH